MPGSVNDPVCRQSERRWIKCRGRRGIPLPPGKHVTMGGEGGAGQ